MTLSEKVKSIYPELNDDDFTTVIILQNDGSGDYIREWNHPTLAQPTDAELEALETT